MVKVISIADVIIGIGILLFGVVGITTITYVVHGCCYALLGSILIYSGYLLRKGG